MNPNTATIAEQGSNPTGAAERLGELVDYITNELPDAVVLVAKIINANSKGFGAPPDQHQEERTKEYQDLIPGVVQKRAQEGKRVLCVDFSNFPMNDDTYGDVEKGPESGHDGIHLSDYGYELMAKWWYDYIHQIPKDWIVAPKGTLNQGSCTLQ